MDRLRWAVNCSLWTPTREEWMTALSVIQREEAKRVAQFVYQKDAKFALVGRVLIRSGLAQHLPEQKLFSLSRSDRGKPILVLDDGQEDDHVHFNISHQGNYVVLATEADSIVGVDVMQITRPRSVSLADFFCLMKKKFSACEWQQISSPCYSLQKQLSNFYRFWTLKESFVKAEGSGLAYGLQKLEFECCADWPPSAGACCVGSKLTIQGHPAEGWVFEESLLNDDHCVSVAVSCDKQRRSLTFAPPILPSSLPLPFTVCTMEDLLSKLHAEDFVQDDDNEIPGSQWQTFQEKPAAPIIN